MMIPEAVFVWGYSFLTTILLRRGMIFLKADITILLINFNKIDKYIYKWNFLEINQRTEHGNSH